MINKTMKKLGLIFAVLGIYFFAILFYTMFKEPFDEYIFIITWSLTMICTSLFLYLSKQTRP